MTAPEISAEEIDNEPSATAAEWLEVGPEDLSPDGFEPRVDPASISELVLREPEPEAGL
jgi:hypothetical protein